MVGGIRKVLLLVENAPVPYDPRVWNEATTLREAGYQVSIISPKSALHHLQESYSFIDNIHIYRYKMLEMQNTYLAYICEYSQALLMTLFLSVRIWRRHGFDVIHAANPPDIFFLIGLFYRCFGKKFVFDQHDLSPELFQVIFRARARPLYRLLRLLERCSYRLADAVITTNETFRRIAIERGRCAAEKVFVVRNGPDLTRLKAYKLESELRLPNRRRYLLAYLGVMGRQDGVEYAVYALDHLIHTCGRRDVSAVFVGAGSSLLALQALVRKLGLDEYVSFTGWQERENALRYLAAADIGLVPDPRNGLNEFCTLLKALEYMTLGLPMVCFDLAETRFSAGCAALYAQPNEVEDFAGQIETLLNDQALRQSMGASGRKRVEEALGWEHSREHLLAAYERLFQRGIRAKRGMRGACGARSGTPD